MSNVQIKSMGDDTTQKKLSINGHEIPGVRSVSIYCVPDNPTRMILDLNVNNVSIDDRVVKYDKHLLREMDIVLKERILPNGSIPNITV